MNNVYKMEFFEEEIEDIIFALRGAIRSNQTVIARLKTENSEKYPKAVAWNKALVRLKNEFIHTLEKGSYYD